MFIFLAYHFGVRTRENNISIQSINRITEIKNVKSVIIYNFEGKWDISVTVNTPCGTAGVKTGDMDTFDEAVTLAKEKIECFATCGGK